MQGKVSPERSAQQVYVGVDVCKAWLDVYLHPTGTAFRFDNDRKGLERLVRELARHPVVLVAMEATGKFHMAAHRGLDAAGLPVAIVNPLRARLFAQAAGVLAKTDVIDARLLALLAESLRPRATAPASRIFEELRELTRARQAAAREAAALMNRHSAATSAFLRRELARRIKAAEAHIARIDAEIRRRIGEDEALARRFDILVSIPGVGFVTALAMLADLSELGSCSGKEASMIAGLAPLACDSGERAGQRHIRGGRAQVRTALYMAALSASRCNPDLKAAYDRLRRVGKGFKVAIVAIMRKLVVLANALVKDNRTWAPQRP
jgi:transposase